MIKKTSQSQYYNPNWKVYVCSNCGDEYYTRYKDSDLCIGCLNIDKNKLKQHNIQEYQKTLKFKENHITKKKRK